MDTETQKRRTSQTTGEEENTSQSKIIVDERGQSSSPLANTSDPNSVGDQSPTPMSELAIPTRVVTAEKIIITPAHQSEKQVDLVDGR